MRLFLILMFICAQVFAGEIEGLDGFGETPKPVRPKVVTKQPAYPRLNRKAVAIKVDTEIVRLEQVVDEWIPAWQELILQAASGSVSAEECDKKLAGEWKRALESMMREELFYQQAVRGFERLFQDQIDRKYNSQQSSLRSARRTMSRQSIEATFRQQRDDNIKAQIDKQIDRRIRMAGGIEGLRRLLVMHDITWNEWRELQARKVYTQAYLGLVLAPAGEFRPKDIRNFYKNNTQLFTEPGVALFRHIFFSFKKRKGRDKAYADAWEVYDKLRLKKMTFREAAKEYSDDPVSKKKSGLESSQPVVERVEWLKDVREEVMRQKLGNLGALLESSEGFHMAMLERMIPGKVTPFSIAQDEIERQMHAKYWEKEVGALYTRLRSDAVIRVLTPDFPKMFSCEYLSKGKGGLRPFVRKIGTTKVKKSEATE